MAHYSRPFPRKAVGDQHVLLVSPIYLAAVRDLHHKHEQLVILHGVEDAVVAHENALDAIARCELLWSRAGADRRAERQWHPPNAAAALHP